jgi:hypothetical protein
MFPVVFIKSFWQFQSSARSRFSQRILVTSPENLTARRWSVGTMINILFRNGWFGLILAAIAIVWLALNSKFVGFGLGLGALVASLKRDRPLNACVYLSISVFYLALQDTGVFGGKSHSGSLLEFFIGVIFFGLVVIRVIKLSGQEQRRVTGAD